jgi:predicted metal-binding protein
VEWIFIVGFAVAGGAYGHLLDKLGKLQKELAKSTAIAQAAIRLAEDLRDNPPECEYDRAVRKHRREMRELGIFTDR